LSDGALNEIVIELSPGVDDVMMGALGNVLGIAVTLDAVTVFPAALDAFK
jgi:hypothetical protein